MTDYGEEQRNELEALEAIYPDSFTGRTCAAADLQPPRVEWDGPELPRPSAGQDGEGDSEAARPRHPSLSPQVFPKHSCT